MRSFFQPSDGPEWLGRVLLSIRGALNDIWDNPFGLWRVATTDLPAAADYGGRLAYNVTSARVTYSDAAAWQEVQPYAAVLASFGGLSIVQGDLIYGSAAATVSRLAKDTNATRYLANSGASNNPAWAQVDLTNGVTGRLPFANVTQGSALSVLGVTGNAGADVASIAAGTDGQVLRRSGTAVAFGAVSLSTAAAITGTLPAGNGGTGIASYAVGDILYASTTTALSKLADVATGNVLISGGVTTAPAWGKVGLTTHVSGTLPVANGGTGDTGTAWTSFTPASLVSATGTLTTASATGRYKQIGKTVYVQISVTITTNGSGGAAIKVALPVAASTSGDYFLAGQETLGGKTLSGRIAAVLAGTVVYVTAYDNTYPGASGATLNMSGTYEAA